MPEQICISDLYNNFLVKKYRLNRIAQEEIKKQILPELKEFAKRTITDALKVYKNIKTVDYIGFKPEFDDGEYPEPQNLMYINKRSEYEELEQIVFSILAVKKTQYKEGYYDEFKDNFLKKKEKEFPVVKEVFKKDSGHFLRVTGELIRELHHEDDSYHYEFKVNCNGVVSLHQHNLNIDY